MPNRKRMQTIPHSAGKNKYLAPTLTAKVDLQQIKDSCPMKAYPTAILFALTTAILLSSCTKDFEKNYPPTVTAEKLLSVELGMSKDQVQDILGLPVNEREETFEYTKPSNYNYPMIWIHFDSSGVREVYIKKYFWWDDQGIYGLSRDEVTGEIHQWGEPAVRELIH